MTANDKAEKSAESGVQSPELAALCETVRASREARWCNRLGCAPAPCSRDGFTTLQMPSGILEYEPSEYTITALSGTPVSEVIAALASKGQHLPFDPMLAEEGATVGGMIASGLNGPGRLRYGGIRDFFIGIQFIDGSGIAIRGGGKVVKNAAGFDFPKLMVGSLGKLGAITEATFKVFPRPAATLTAVAAMQTLVAARDLAVQIARGPFDADAVEVLSGGQVIVRLAGHEAALQPRLNFMRQQLAADFALMPDADRFWQSCLSWSAGSQPASAEAAAKIKIPLTPAVVPSLDTALASLGAVRRYSVACGIAFIHWPLARGIADLHGLLLSLKLGGVNFEDENSPALIGHQPGLAFLKRVQHVLDPQSKFGDFT